MKDILVIGQDPEGRCFLEDKPDIGLREFGVEQRVDFPQGFVGEDRGKLALTRAREEQEFMLGREQKETGGRSKGDSPSRTMH